MRTQYENGLASYQQRKARLEKQIEKIDLSRPFRLIKKTPSNLFHYHYSKDNRNQTLSLQDFNHVLRIDPEQKVLDVEGLTTYETIIQATLPYHLAPTVTPELKHITIGGAIVGIGIESTCYSQGFVHDGLLEAEVLLADGRIVTCAPSNEYADLFYALPNSYGTLGYILRAKIKLMSIGPYAHIKVKRFTEVKAFLDAMLEKTQEADTTFIEGLLFAPSELYLATGAYTASVPYVDDIYHQSIFYQLLRKRSDVYLIAKDYLFRYDPDWFWHIPQMRFYNVFRKICPKSLRHSGFYKKYMDYKTQFVKKFGLEKWFEDNMHETLIQDWEVPWEHAQQILETAFKEVDLEGMPWAALPVKPTLHATLYPMPASSLYFNLGCYSSAKKRPKQEVFYATKRLDEECFRLNGIKMLYSTSFLTQTQFDSIYNGDAYRRLKHKYDPAKIFSNLFDINS